MGATVPRVFGQGHPGIPQFNDYCQKIKRNAKELKRNRISGKCIPYFKEAYQMFFPAFFKLIEQVKGTADFCCSEWFEDIPRGIDRLCTADCFCIMGFGKKDNL